jgi:uncharacterized protein YndB with AHSA1/START domain
VRRWFHAGHDWETTEAKVDLRVGGEVRLVTRNPTTTRTTTATLVSTSVTSIALSCRASNRTLEPRLVCRIG